VDAEGLHTLPAKVKDITQAPKPKNASQLRSFLGLLNIMANSSPIWFNFSPLQTLLHHNVDGTEMFYVLRPSQLPSRSDIIRRLAHYNPGLPITLAGNASDVVWVPFFSCNQTSALGSTAVIFKPKTPHMPMLTNCPYFGCLQMQSTLAVYRCNERAVPRSQDLQCLSN